MTTQDLETKLAEWKAQRALTHPVDVSPRCATHPAFYADSCPGCGTGYHLHKVVPATEPTRCTACGTTLTIADIRETYRGTTVVRTCADRQACTRNRFTTHKGE